MIKWSWYIIIGVCCFNCSDDVEGYEPTTMQLDIPQLFSDNIIAPVIPSDNPLTIEGVALGKKLFFDPILSANNTQSCATCIHLQMLLQITHQQVMVLMGFLEFVTPCQYLI